MNESEFFIFPDDEQVENGLWLVPLVRQPEEDQLPLLEAGRAALKTEAGTLVEFPDAAHPLGCAVLWVATVEMSWLPGIENEE